MQLETKFNVGDKIYVCNLVKDVDETGEVVECFKPLEVSIINIMVGVNYEKKNVQYNCSFKINDEVRSRFYDERDCFSLEKDCWERCEVKDGELELIKL